MNHKQHTTGTRLRIEELESRSMLAAMPDAVAFPIVVPQGSDTFSGGGFPAQAAADASISGIGAQGVIAVGLMFVPPNPTNVNAVPSFVGNEAPQPVNVSSSPDAGSGVGQMTITNGANTPGIGSFATPVISSRL